MSEEIKLYKHFTEKLGQLGGVRRAWFTTFNLDVSFFEKYMLSALQEKEYDTLHTPDDYEAMSEQLSTVSAEELEEGKMEVIVFYDPRALISTGRQKKTTLPLYPVDVKTLRSPENDLDFNYGVFHPKVILIETIQDEYWLMVSSANLTFGGWAHNRESFFFDQITDTAVARELFLFFGALSAPNKEFDNHPLLYKLQSGKMKGGPSGWQFHSSFSRKTFYDIFLQQSGELLVWSPYFAEDISALLDKLLDTGIESITLVPAKNELQKIRITEEQYRACIAHKGVTFRQDRLPASAIDAFVHAKLWLCPEKLAIGSWNMTRAGINRGKGGANNVEAGIIHKLTPGKYRNIVDGHPLAGLRTPKHLSEQEMEEEKEGLLEPFEVAIDILIDWEKLQLTLAAPTYNRLLKHVEETDFILLPGFGKQPVRILEKPLSIRVHRSAFLNDRFFEVETRSGVTVYKGFLREKGLAQRPSRQFASIGDLLKGWINEQPENRPELHRLAYGAEGADDSLSGATYQILTSGHQSDWFSGFQGFESILCRIRKTEKEPMRKRRLELIRIGRVVPGNLTELQSHVSQLRDYYQQQSEQLVHSPVYLWFLIEKANHVFRNFNNAIDSDDEKIKPIPNISFESLFTSEQLGKMNQEQIEKWKKYTLQKLRQ
jgi:hypothetical protein